MTLCALCGHYVDPNSRSTYRRIEGWDRKGKAGGSDITLRRPTGELAHAYCVDRAKAGISPEQEALL